jgi:hypothetical protein
MSFANYRITRLIVKDDFPPLLWARNKVIDARPDHIVPARDPEPAYYEHWWLGALVSCHYCASAYSSGAMVFLVWLLYPIPLPILIWFAVWGMSVIIYKKLD